MCFLPLGTSCQWEPGPALCRKISSICGGARGSSWDWHPRFCLLLEGGDDLLNAARWKGSKQEWEIHACLPPGNKNVFGIDEYFSIDNEERWGCALRCAGNGRELLCWNCHVCTQQRCCCEMLPTAATQSEVRGMGESHQLQLHTNFILGVSQLGLGAAWWEWRSTFSSSLHLKKLIANCCPFVQMDRMHPWYSVVARSQWGHKQGWVLLGCRDGAKTAAHTDLAQCAAARGKCAEGHMIVAGKMSKVLLRSGGCFLSVMLLCFLKNCFSFETKELKNKISLCWVLHYKTYT